MKQVAGQLVCCVDAIKKLDFRQKQLQRHRGVIFLYYGSTLRFIIIIVSQRRKKQYLCTLHALSIYFYMPRWRVNHLDKGDYCTVLRVIPRVFLDHLRFGGSPIE